MLKLTALKLWARLMLGANDLPSSVEEIPTTPDLTMPFIILGCVLIAGITVYVIVRVWLHYRHEEEVLNRGTRAGIPHIKALDNDLPAGSLNSLYDKDKKNKED